jgi:hypothetical protein
LRVTLLVRVIGLYNNYAGSKNSCKAILHWVHSESSKENQAFSAKCYKIVSFNVQIQVKKLHRVSIMALDNLPRKKSNQHF